MGGAHSSASMGSNSQLRVITTTWTGTKESHGLFDFSSSNTNKKYSMLSIQRATNLYRSSLHDISASAAKDQSQEPMDNMLLRIHPSD